MKLFIHAGIGKTGTSAFQSSLFLNKDILLKYGYLFPVSHLPKKYVANASAGHINSGNFSGKKVWGEDWPQNIDCEFAKSQIKSILDSELNSDTKAIIFSSEMFLSKILKHKELTSLLIDLQQDYEVEFLLCARNIYEHIFSIYQQSVKRGGQIYSFGHFLETSNYLSSGLRLLSEGMTYLEKNGFNFKIFNYSFHKRNISNTIYSHIGLNKGEINELKKSNTINRSLSYCELILILAINNWSLSNGNMQDFQSLSDFAVNKYPAIQSCKPFYTIDQVDHISSNNARFIEHINNKLQPEESLSLEIDQGFLMKKAFSMEDDIQSISLLINLLLESNFHKL